MRTPTARSLSFVFIVAGLGIAATADAMIALVGSYDLGEPGTVDPSVGYVPLRDGAGTANDFTSYQKGSGALPSIQTTGLAAPGSTAAIELIQTPGKNRNAGWWDMVGYGLTDDWATQLWVKTPDATDANQSYLFFSTNSSAGNSVSLEFNNGRVNLLQNVDTGTRVIGFAYSPDEWFRATLISYDGTLSLYEDSNGSAVTSTRTLTHALDSLMLGFGLGAPYLRGASGTYDELRVWSFDHTTDSLNDVIAATVPEPASSALLGIGALGLYLRRRRTA